MARRLIDVKSLWPIPMLLWCPECGARHLDEGEFATKIHHTHSCQACGHTWRPAVVPTVGVQHLPGFKNARPPTTPAEIRLKNLRRFETIERALKFRTSSAEVKFTIVPHGWQCDVEIEAKGLKPAKGTVCRDWGDNDKSAKKLLDKLVEMGRTGQP